MRARMVNHADQPSDRLAVRARPVRLHAVGAFMGVFARRLTDWMVQPEAYAAAGLEPRLAVRVARSSPHRRATNRFLLRRLAAFYAEIGLLDGVGERTWRRLGVL